MPLSPTQRSYLAAISANICIACAWLTPGSTLCALLGWLGAFLYVVFLHSSEKRYLPAFVGGMLLNLIGFYWLNDTIVLFGGFPPIIGALLFLLYAAASSLQFVVTVFLFQRLPSAGLPRLALAWTVSEFITPRIFPWCLGHTQLAFSELAQIAELGGPLMITFLVLWVAEELYESCRSSRLKLSLCLALIALSIACLFGMQRINTFTSAEATSPSLKIAVLQANIIDIQERDNVRYFSIDTARYLEMSRKIAAPDTLIIWPESALMPDFRHGSLIPNFVSSVAESSELSKLPSDVPLLVGTVMIDRSRHFYNSALGIFPDGSIAAPYHKRILMPFGEFTPLTSDTFPSTLLPKELRNWLRQVNASAGEFNAGSEAAVFSYPASIAQPSLGDVKVSPLICYEDVIPAPARESVLKGAELLVNITNDTWFGNTVAPRQHHLIASFRAIENRRYLVRSTNSGLTAVVNALGQTVSQLPPYSEGTLLAKVHLISYKTIYTRFIGDRIWWGLTLVTLCMLVVSACRGKKSA